MVLFDRRAGAALDGKFALLLPSQTAAARPFGYAAKDSCAGALVLASSTELASQAYFCCTQVHSTPVLCYYVVENIAMLRLQW